MENRTDGEGARAFLNQVITFGGYFRRNILHPFLGVLLVVYAIIIIAREFNILSSLNLEQMDRGITTAGVIFCAERLIALERMTRRRRTYTYEDEAAGFEALRDLVKDKSIRSIDAIQLSGQIAFPALTGMMRDHPSAKVRLLLLHNSTCKHFDTDRNEYTEADSKINYHTHRVLMTKQGLMDVQNNWTYKRRAQLEIRYYNSAPSLCAILINDDFVCVTWYRSYMNEARILRIQSHDSPAILPGEVDSASLARFVREQFEALWETSSPSHR